MVVGRMLYINGIQEVLIGGNLGIHSCYNKSMKFRQSKYDINKDGIITNTITGKQITPTIKSTGYNEVRLCENGKPKGYSHHRMVYECFHGEIPSGYHVNHINGVKTDNRIINLEIVTPAENNERRVNLLKGSDVHTAKLTRDDVINIRKSDKTIKELTKIYKVSRSTISRARIGKSWKHI